MAVSFIQLHSGVRIRLECKEHRHYKALMRPRVPCEMCWRIWINRNPIY